MGICGDDNEVMVQGHSWFLYQMDIYLFSKVEQSISLTDGLIPTDAVGLADE